MSKDVVVKAVESGRDFRTFILFPWKIYRGNPNWVPPLIMDQKNLFNTKKNPFFKHSIIRSFLAFKENKAVGRISAVIDHNYNDFQNDRAGIFGFFESIDDKAVSNVLFEAAEEWIREQKMERMFGPANPSTNHILGLLIDAFDQPPMVMMPYNPPYYEKLFEQYGLKKAKDLYAYHMDESIPISDKIKRVTAIIKKKHNITVRPAEIKEFDREVELIKTVWNEAWERNWGFVPWTDEEFEHLGKEIKTIVNPELILLAFMDHEIAAFCLTLPDVNQALKRINGRLLPFGLLKLLWYARKLTRMRVAIMGVRKKYRMMGIEAVFCHETYVQGVKHGLTDAEISWILEDNLPMLNIMERWGSRRYKTYRMYEKEF